MSSPDKKEHFFDKPANVKGLIYGLFALSGILLIIDLFVPTHGYFGWDERPGSYAALGFVSFVGLVLVGKHLLRPVVKRDEGYYD